MTPEEALRRVRGFGAAGRYFVSGHARRRMDERGVQQADLRHALTTARACAAQKTGSWRVDGADLDGDDLTMIVVIEDGLLVVTLF